MHIQFTSIDKCKTWGQLYLFTTLSISMSCSTSLNNIRFKVPVIFHALDKVHAEELFDAKKSQEYLNARSIKSTADDSPSYFLATDPMKFNDRTLGSVFGKTRTFSCYSFELKSCDVLKYHLYDMQSLPIQPMSNSGELLDKFTITISRNVEIKENPKVVLEGRFLEFSLFFKNEFIE
ncbi:hypothetical protein HMI56_004457, partial [Coelomomyces lativittatus]